MEMLMEYIFWTAMQWVCLLLIYSFWRLLFISIIKFTWSCVLWDAILLVYSELIIGINSIKHNENEQFE